MNNVSVTKDDEITVAVNGLSQSFQPAGWRGVHVERESEMPEYVVTVMSSPRTVTVPVWVVIPAGLVIALIVVFVRKKRAA